MLFHPTLALLVRMVSSCWTCTLTSELACILCFPPGPPTISPYLLDGSQLEDRYVNVGIQVTMAVVMALCAMAI